MTRISLKTLIRDQELNEDKLWRTTALIYVDDACFAITVIEAELVHIPIDTSSFEERGFGSLPNKIWRCCPCTLVPPPLNLVSKDDMLGRVKSLIS
jgi:hypothetical protein